MNISSIICLPNCRRDRSMTDLSQSYMTMYNGNDGTAC